MAFAGQNALIPAFLSSPPVGHLRRSDDLDSAQSWIEPMIIVPVQGPDARDLSSAGVERVRETCSRNADTLSQALDRNQAVVEEGHFGAEQESPLGTAADSRIVRTGTRLPIS